MIFNLFILNDAKYLGYLLQDLKYWTIEQLESITDQISTIYRVV